MILKQIFCIHKFVNFWYSGFGNIITKQRYFAHEKKILACEKCGKIKKQQ